jgi:methylenetetrahydrofolate dehydrogenase (NADP+)/methenyltetrahydrofolate cyclohydrolase
MEGRPLAERIRAQVAEDVRELGAIGLATVQVGEDEASTIYLRLKHQAASRGRDRLGRPQAAAHHLEEEVLEEVAALNADDAIDGILLQLPLPEHIDEARVIAAVDPVKDVDGFHPFNAGQLYLGRPTHVPATPLGVMALLAEYNVRLDGARAVVVGRRHDRRQARRAPAAAGARDGFDLPFAYRRPRALHAGCRCPGRRGRACRRLSPQTWLSPAPPSSTSASTAPRTGSSEMSTRTRRRAPAFLTPVPGGVGPMTIAMLLQNTVRAARYRRKLLAFPE